MKTKAFTLLELVMVVVVIGILATLGYPVYRNMEKEAGDYVCVTNQQAIAAAFKIEAMESDVVPADLSQIPPKSIEKAYAQILKEKGAWKIKLAYYIVGLKDRGLAYAGVLSKIGKGNLSLISCPFDNDSPVKNPATGRSYALNNSLIGKRLRDIKDDDPIIVADCKDSVLIVDMNGLPTNANLVHTKQRNIFSPKELTFVGITNNQEVVIKENNKLKNTNWGQFKKLNNITTNTSDIKHNQATR
ncbi:MAG: prepilin-type N-terminal cleavage/methylation domain-containing protein [Candidatus Omnitrophota bacterium]